jgi:Holliday junction resolvase
MTQYQKGANFERQLKKDMEECGHYVCRSAGSHGDWDLVAIDRSTNEILLIQCKDKALTKKDWDKYDTAKNKFPHKEGIKFFLVCKDNRERKWLEL